jgi:hypothetical protein
MIIPLLKMLKNLTGYLFVAFFLFSPFVPYGHYIGYLLALFFLIQLPFIRKNDYCLSTWYVIDILACHCCHGTGDKRSISGWTGQHMKNKKRYYYQAKVIDFAFGKNHCLREYQKEKAKGHVDEDTKSG